MSIRLLIADAKEDYAQHLSNVLSRKYGDTFEVSVCSAEPSLHAQLAGHVFDVILADPALLTEHTDLSSVRLPLLLWDERLNIRLPERYMDCERLMRYQRISALTRDILGHYAKVAPSGGVKTASGRAQITAVYAPSGGCGKTTVALAYAMKQASAGRKALYLCLENFASTPVYFESGGKNLSDALGGLEESNAALLLQSVCRRDEKTGVLYFCAPDTYDDLSVISQEELDRLLDILAEGALCSEVIVDLSTACDHKTRSLLAKADKVLLVCEPARVSQEKLRQFMTQHNVFESIRSKTVLVVNKGGTSRHKQERIGWHILLPAVPSDDANTVYQTLAAGGLREE